MGRYHSSNTVTIYFTLHALFNLKSKVKYTWNNCLIYLGISAKYDRKIKNICTVLKGLEAAVAYRGHRLKDVFASQST